jgi:predicted nucleic acid-binding protein
VIYLDTSAFIKLYLHEAGSEEVQARVTAQDEPLPVWDLLEAELCNALWLKVHWKDLTPKQARTQITLFAQRKSQGFYAHPDLDRVALNAAFHELTRWTPECGCRTLDIYHVACARLLKVEAFLSYDRKQRLLAAKSGLPLFPG